MFDPSLLVFKEKSHRYYYDGEHIPGVTTILGMISKGDGIIQWSVNQALEHIAANLVGELSTEDVAKICADAKYAHKRVKEEAGTIGGIAHDWIEHYLKGDVQPLPEQPNARNSCEAALQWLKEHNWKTLEVEKVIYHPKYKYAGKLDWKAEIDGVLAIPDWKTSKGIWSTYRYQTAAYLKAEEELTGDYIPDRWICRIDKTTGMFKPEDALHMTRDTLEADFETFLAALTIYRREAELRREG